MERAWKVTGKGLEMDWKGTSKGTGKGTVNGLERDWKGT